MDVVLMMFLLLLVTHIEPDQGTVWIPSRQQPSALQEGIHQANRERPRRPPDNTVKIQTPS